MIVRESYFLDSRDPNFIHLHHVQLVNFEADMGGPLWFERSSLRWVVDTLAVLPRRKARTSGSAHGPGAGLARNCRALHAALRRVRNSSVGSLRCSASSRSEKQRQDLSCGLFC